MMRQERLDEISMLLRVLETTTRKEVLAANGYPASIEVNVWTEAELDLIKNLLLKLITK